MSFKKARGFQMLLTILTLGVALLVTMSIESASAQGVLVTDTITSPSLEGNLLDDPATRNMTIDLPPGYDTSDRRYPVLYLMPGLGASDRWWAYGEYSEFFALADTVIALDPLNPSIAARMVAGFNKWKRFDAKRQQLMKKELERIKGQPSLSKGVYEIVSRALNG